MSKMTLDEAKKSPKLEEGAKGTKKGRQFGGPAESAGSTVLHGGMGTGISEASKRVPISSFATQGGKQVSSHFRQRN